MTSMHAKIALVSESEPSEQVFLRSVAALATARLAAARDIDAVLLYGSVARGDAAAGSDIDLLVIGQDRGQTIAELRRRVGSADPDRRVSFVFHTRQSFADLVHDGSRFLVHLRREGEVLLDRTGDVTEFLAGPWRPVSVEIEIAMELERLANYDRPEIFGGQFLFPLAHVFTIGKAIVMARLADEGHFEFNRRRAFEAFASRHPDLASDVALVAGLEPFVARTRRRESDLPFPPTGDAAMEGLHNGVAAIRRLARAEA
jgi:predicted nucleotidyltransferase